MTNEKTRNSAFYRLKYYLSLNNIEFIEKEANKIIECENALIMEGIVDPEKLVICCFEKLEMFLEEKTVVDIVNFLKARRTK